ncbi:MFS transporter [Chryseobacterium oryctis]|uniref:MFS transporter n=1 Tax=Chryseobacterium oryctis TaxID=2952618 RepID=A0ABT3HQ12_9FLAO|nr:MFS transporter [Chryseobacterium oryctis]MCW3161785.1 MFS transporter [Chryseobacterium oryctis]
MNNLFFSFLNSYKGLSKESWMLCMIMLIYRSGSMVLPFLGVYFADHLGFSLEETGIILGFYGLGAILGAYLGGRCTDKIGHFRVQMLSLFLCIPGFIIIPEIKNIYSLSIAFFIQSCINEFFLPANSVAITRYSSTENRARAFSLNRMALHLGFFIGPSLGGILASLSYSLIFYVNAFTSLISGIILYFYFKDRKDINVKKENQNSHNFQSPYKDKYFLIFIFFCTIYTICLMQLFSSLPLFYNNLEISKAEIGVIFGYCGILLLIIEMPLVNILIKTLKTIYVVILGLILLFTGYFILAFFTDIYSIFISITLIAVSGVLINPFLSTIISIRAEGKNIGGYMGLFSATFSVALFISPFLGTFLAQNYGFNTLWLIISSLIIISIGGIYYTYTSKLVARDNNT